MLENLQELARLTKETRDPSLILVYRRGESITHVAWQGGSFLTVLFHEGQRYSFYLSSTELGRYLDQGWKKVGSGSR